MVSDKKIFHVFTILAFVKYVTPRAVPLLPQGHNLNKLVECPLGDATYQISKDLGHVVSEKKYFKFSS